MIYDAIVNGARNLAFYGGNNPRCLRGEDTDLGWNWTFWNRTLEALVEEINAGSPLAPALVSPGTTRVLPTSDPSTQAISRSGVGGDVWVIAARSGGGTERVTIGGLPADARMAAVYTESRSVAAADGTLVDSFDRWDVHVYHFAAASGSAPVLRSFSPAAAPPGASVRIRGSGFSRVSSVAFGGTRTRFSVESDSVIAATVPAAPSGTLAVTAPTGTAATATSFTVMPGPNAWPPLPVDPTDDGEAAPHRMGPARARPRGPARVTVCHRGRTVRVPTRDLRRHLRHGDRRNRCIRRARP